MIRQLTILIISVLLADFSYSQNFQDCNTSFEICELGTYHFKEMAGFGTVQENKQQLKCSKEFKETNSKWIRWTAEKAGHVLFVIDPHHPKDDIDFVLFTKNGSCENLTELRCMASGRSIGGEKPSQEKTCEGSTGLSIQSMDEFESSGCKYIDDNYLKYLSVSPGEEFILMVNNYTSDNGFSITFEGSAGLEQAGNCDYKKEIKGLEILSLYPNPAKDQITIDIANLLEENIHLEVLNIQGQTLKSEINTPSVGSESIQLNVENLASGSYILRISQGAFSSTKRFIKQ